MINTISNRTIFIFLQKEGKLSNFTAYLPYIYSYGGMNIKFKKSNDSDFRKLHINNFTSIKTLLVIKFFKENNAIF